MPTIPSHAKCVFKGKIFDTYQWEQKLYNGKTKTFEMLRRPDTVQVFPVYNGDVFYIEQRQPDKLKSYISLIGGRVDSGEEKKFAAERELKEESGIKSSDLSLFKTFEPNQKADWTVYFYIARNCSFGKPSFDGGEKIILKKLPIDKFVDEIIMTRTMENTHLLPCYFFAEKLRKELKK